MLLDIAIIVFLMVAAILLILAEIFLLPGITLAGIGGAIFAIGGVVFAYTVGMWVGHLTLSLSIITFGVIFAWLLRSQSFNKIALKTDIDSKLTSSKDLRGVTTTYTYNAETRGSRSHAWLLSARPRLKVLTWKRNLKTS